MAMRSGMAKKILQIEKMGLDGVRGMQMSLVYLGGMNI